MSREEGVSSRSPVVKKYSPTFYPYEDGAGGGRGRGRGGRVEEAKEKKKDSKKERKTSYILIVTLVTLDSSSSSSLCRFFSPLLTRLTSTIAPRPLSLLLASECESGRERARFEALTLSTLKRFDKSASFQTPLVKLNNLDSIKGPRSILVT